MRERASIVKHQTRVTTPEIKYNFMIKIYSILKIYVTGVRQMLGLHFIKTELLEKESGKFYSYLFNLRQTGDYDDFVDLIKRYS
jgi:hypothetical protein